MTGETPSRPARWRPGAWSFAALVAVAGILGGGVLAGQILDRPSFGAVTQHVGVSTLVGPLTTDYVVVQPIMATEDDLSGVTAVLSTQPTGCTVEATLQDEGGALVASSTVGCEQVETNQPERLMSFDPLEDSAGRVYTLTVSSSSTAENPVGIFAGPYSSPALPMQEPKLGSDVSAVVNALYGPDQSAVSELWSALDRVDLFGPPWSGRVSLLLLAVVAVAAGVGCVITGGRDRLRAAVVFIALLALARGLVWSAVIPPLQGMDEDSHSAYAQYLAVEESIPRRHTTDSPRAISGQLKAIRATGNVGAFAAGNRADYTETSQDALEAALNDASADGDGDSSTAGYPPVYYVPAALLYESWPGDVLDRVLAMRLWSVLLGVGAAVSTLLAMRYLMPSAPRVAALLAVATSSMPMLAHQFAVVNNDALALFATFTGFALGLRAAQGKVSLRHLAVCGAFVGLALLAKPYGIALLPVAVIAAVVGAFRAGLPLVQALFLRPSVVAISAVATYAPWPLVQALGKYPSASIPTSAGAQDRSLGAFLLHFYQGEQSEFRRVFGEELFGRFGRLNVWLPEPVYDVTWLVLQIGVALTISWLIVAAAAMVRRRPRAVSTPPDRPARRAGAEPAIWCLLVATSTLFTLMAAGYLYFTGTGTTSLLQGRYFLIGLPAVMALPTTIAAYFHRGLAPTVAAATFAASFALQCVSVSTLLVSWFY